MSRYVYPAVFSPEGSSYNVTFPDLPCATYGKDIQNAIEMAKDALELLLYSYETDGLEIPKASDISSISHNKESFTTYIEADTLAYRKMFNNKAVKKTLTLPEWLNELAQANDINFSQTLQDGLKQKLGIA